MASQQPGGSGQPPQRPGNAASGSNIPRPAQGPPAPRPEGQIGPSSPEGGAGSQQPTPREESVGVGLGPQEYYAHGPGGGWCNLEMARGYARLNYRILDGPPPNGRPKPFGVLPVEPDDSANAFQRQIDEIDAASRVLVEANRPAMEAQGASNGYHHSNDTQDDSHVTSPAPLIQAPVTSGFGSASATHSRTANGQQQSPPGGQSRSSHSRHASQASASGSGTNLPSGHSRHGSQTSTSGSGTNPPVGHSRQVSASGSIRSPTHGSPGGHSRQGSSASGAGRSPQQGSPSTPRGQSGSGSGSANPSTSSPRGSGHRRGGSRGGSGGTSGSATV